MLWRWSGVKPLQSALDSDQSFAPIDHVSHYSSMDQFRRRTTGLALMPEPQAEARLVLSASW
jgi:hypothetical protein